MCAHVEASSKNVGIQTEEMEMEAKKTQLKQVEKGDSNLSDFLPSTGNNSIRGRGFSNMFAAKKTVAQGMMDIALITANANQLRYVLEYSQQTTSFYLVLILIIISMFLQVIVGVFLIFKGRFDLRHEKLEHAMRMNNYIVFGVFLITVINVFIAAFSVNGLTGNFSSHP